MTASPHRSSDGGSLPPWTPERLPTLPGGGWASVPGTAVGVAAGDIKGNGADRDDVVILVAPGSAAGLTTTNAAAAAPCLWTRAWLPGKAHAVVVNSGNANAATGSRGAADVEAMAARTAAALGCPLDRVLVCSTGVIGVPLPMDRLLPAIDRACALHGDGAAAARAIMTTDTRPKEVAVAVEVAGHRLHVGGMAKGSGMIHPGMATMLGFITTDAVIDPQPLQDLLTDAVDRSFHAITVDGDQSTNDTVIVQATGRGPDCSPGTPGHDALRRALDQVCCDLAVMIAADGEGAHHLVTCVVRGLSDDRAARRAARAVVGSNLVKAAVHGHDPNWGRIVSALGQARVPGLDRLDLDLCRVPVMRHGQALSFDEARVSAAMEAPEVLIQARLPGEGLGVAWGCDLSADYVRINADYRS
ncbi:MAG: bifunctional glutamate N-acetyltransferase/amino-acid acetyltransferase ArgJ [Deltaproteobacteria bacterium]|nr:MAG: bifunctional glutamate N-acetyltransferase/amino-acid acetyltransferase ArgJ [Deltaproteobacteria bacterium]